jgi:hypothetical protein
LKVTIDVPKIFDIKISQIERFLVSSGWNKLPHNDNLDKYQSQKYSNVYVVLPKHEGGLVDEEHIVFSALRLIANVNNNSSIKTIIDRVLKEV